MNDSIPKKSKKGGRGTSFVEDVAKLKDDEEQAASCQTATEEEWGDIVTEWQTIIAGVGMT